MKLTSILPVACVLLVPLIHPPTRALADEAAIEATVIVDTTTTLRTMNPRQLGGTNVAMWYFPAVYGSPEVRSWMGELRAGQVRIPGGSWANVVYWNGNGVRGPDGLV